MKRFTCAILIITILILNVHTEAYATVGPGVNSYISALKNVIEMYVATTSPDEQETIQAMNALLQSGGFISDIENVGLDGALAQPFIKYMAALIDSSQAEKTTQENIAAIRECIENGVNTSGDNIVINNDLRSYLIDFADYYVEQTKSSIFYAYDLQASQRFLNSNLLSDMAQIMSDNPGCYFGLGADSSHHYFFVFKPNGNKLYGVLKSVQGGYTNIFTFYQAVSSNGITTVQEFIGNSSDDVIAYQSVEDWRLEQIQLEYPFQNSYRDFYYWDIQEGQSCGMNNFREYPISFTTNGAYIETFTSLNALNNYIDTYGVGKNPYYYNNQVWSNFVNSTGDYTVTSSNVNTVTYGDVVSYVNDYHYTNNNYPDNSTVNTWIETTNNNNNSGGGSGGGSGGSGSDDSGSIFDWLKTLGKAIGDLISGVGNFLSEIVAGLVDAITNLLDAITTLITGVLESLTNIFSGLIEFIFAGLPDDIRNVLSLALTVAILISVLKLIRGN